MKAVYNEAELPLNFYLPLGLLNFNLSENFYFQSLNFYGHENQTQKKEYEDGYYLSANTGLKMFTELGKNYDNFSHFIKLQVQYKQDNFNQKKGFLQTNTQEMQESVTRNRDCNEGNKCEFFFLKTQAQSIQWLISNSFYSELNKALKVVYSQDIDYDEDLNPIPGPILQEIDLNFGNSFSLNSFIYLNTQKSQISRTLHTLSAKFFDITTDLTHIYSEDDSDKTNYYNIRTSRQMSSFLSLDAYASYDVKLRKTKGWGVGLNLDKDCWQFKLSYDQTSRVGTQLLDNSIFLGIKFVPLGGYGYTYKWTNNEKQAQRQ